MSNAQTAKQFLDSLTAEESIHDLIDSYSGTSAITPDQFVTLDAAARRIDVALETVFNPSTELEQDIATVQGLLEPIIAAEASA